MDTFAIGIDGSKVTLKIKGIKGYDIPMEYTTPGPFYARLLHDQLMREMSDMFKGIRETSYRRGLKDGRAKRGAASWFSGAFGRD